MPNIDQQKKRQYNIVYKLKKKGFKIHSRSKVLIIYFSDLDKLISNQHAIELIKTHGFKTKQNKQLQMFNN